MRLVRKQRRRMVARGLQDNNALPDVQLEVHVVLVPRGTFLFVTCHVLQLSSNRKLK